MCPADLIGLRIGFAIGFRMNAGEGDAHHCFAVEPGSRLE